MATCFVIQPFDGGKYDKRYEDVFAPAIVVAGLEPYRVDRDPGVSIPIDDIQAGIGSASACLADISTDNPNVWFELGYAIATRQDGVLVCSEERKTSLPFDVQHRQIIRYSSESPRDFKQLHAGIVARLNGIIQRRETLGEVARLQPVSVVKGLDQHEIAVLVSVAEEVEDPDSGVAAYEVRRAMESAGFAKIATTLGLKSLMIKGMLDSSEEQSFQGGTYTSYRLSDAGVTWLNVNRANLVLRNEELPPDTDDQYPAPPEDDIPF